MAKVIGTSVVGDARNKIGGNVHTKVKFGAMVRRKVSPTQPRTTAQRNVRAAFTAISKAWAALTDARRAAWKSLAENYPQKDVFGNTITLTGLQTYQKVNRVRQTLGLVLLDDPPANLTVNYAGPCTITHTVGPPEEMNVAWDNPGIIGGTEHTEVFCTRPLSAGRSAVSSMFRLVFVSAAGLIGPFNILTEYTEKFGAPIVGRRIFCEMRLAKEANGAQSIGSQASVVW